MQDWDGGHIWQVGELTQYLKRLLQDDPELADLTVVGEVSNFSQSPAGHCYFVVKDAGSQLRCVLFRASARRFGALLANGLRVILHGQVSLYEAQGTYQLYVDMVAPEGVGIQHLQFEQLKRRLQEEGLFAAERKRALPPYPRQIAIVTSPRGAVVHDILQVLRRRYPQVAVVIFPTAVQGDGAEEQIAQAIACANEVLAGDLLILARGGGSSEDLQAFNSERVARAIFASRLPVVSAVGHETDFTIADFVADRRAPTPSAAAELVSPDREELAARVRDLGSRLTQVMTAVLQERGARVRHGRSSLLHLSPRSSLLVGRQRIDELQRRLTAALQLGLAERRGVAEGVRQRLSGLSPRATLVRGYAICQRTRTGEVVVRREQVSAGEQVRLTVADGSLVAEVHG